MSREIENRIVQMGFDNKAFERNAAESMSTLEKLNSLIGNFGKGSSSGPSALSKSIGLVGTAINGALGGIQTFGSVAGGIFSTVGGIVANTLGSALSKVESTISSLTSEQFTAGWDKYKDKTSAVQAVVSATAKDFRDLETGVVNTAEQMEVVNGTIERLNWFSDETSYGLIDMTSNLAKFTAANVDLGVAETTMKGIALAAASAGAGTNEASRAMYNLSQALGAGYVRLPDWMSIENANMATVELKETLIQYGLKAETLYEDTAGIIRTVATDAEVTVENFRETLTEGQWATTEVITGAFNEYGRFTELLYTLTEETGATASDIMSMLDEYDSSISEGTDFDIEGYAEELGLTVQEVGDWIDELTSEENRLGRNAFRMGQEAKTFKEAIEATQDAISTTWSSIFEKIFGDYEKARHVWTDFTSFLWDVFAQPVDALNEAMEVYDGGPRIGENILDFLYSIGDIGRSVVDIINEILSVFRKVDVVNAETGELMTITRGWVPVLRTVLDTVSSGLKNSTDRLSGFLQLVRDLRDQKMKKTDILEKYSEILGEDFMEKGLVAKRIIDNIVKTFQGLINGIRGSAKFIGGVLGNVWDSLFPDGAMLSAFDKLFEKTGELGDKLTEFFDDLNGKEFDISNYPTLELLVKTLTTVGQTIGTVAGGIIWLTDKLAGLVKIRLGKNSPLYTLKEMSKWGDKAKKSSEEALKPFVEGFQHSKNPFKDFSVSGIAEWFRNEKEYTSIGDALDSLWERLKTGVKESEFFQNAWEKLKNLPGGLKTAFGNFGEWIVEKFQKVREALGNLDLSGYFDGDGGGFAAGLNKIREVINNFVSTASAGDWVGLLKSISKIYATFVTGKTLTDTSAGVKGFGEGISGLGDGISTLAEKAPKLDELQEAFSSFWGNMQKTFKTARGDTFSKSLLEIGKALLFIAASLFIISVIDTESMFASLAALTIFIAILTGAMIVLQNEADDGGKSLKAAGAGLALMGASLLLVAFAVRVLARLKPDALALGFIAISGMILSMTAALKYLDKTDSTKAAFAMIMLAFAVQMLTVSVVALALVPLVLLAKGLGAAAIMLKMLSSSLKNIQGTDALKAAGAMIMLSIAIDALAVSAIALSLVPLIILAKGLGAVAIMLLIMTKSLSKLNGADVLKAAFAMDLLSVAMLLMVPAIVALGAIKTGTLIQGLLGLAGVFVVLGVAAFAFQKLGLSLTLESLALSVLALGAGLALGGVGILAFVTAMTLLGATAPVLVEGMKIVVRGLIMLIPEIAIAIVEGIVSFAVAITDNIGILAQAIVTCLTTLAETLIGSADIIVGAGLDLFVALLKALAERLPDILKYGWDIAKELGKGIIKGIGDVLGSLGKLMKQAFNFIKGKVREWWGAGRDLSQGLADGIESGETQVIKSSEKVGSQPTDAFAASNEVSSPSKKSTWVGEMIGEGLANGLQNKLDSVEQVSDQLGKAASISVSDLASKADAILNDDIHPTITPVLDLSNVEKGALGIQSMLDARRSVAIAGSISPMNRIEQEPPVTASVMGGLVSELKSAIAQANSGRNENMSFDFYLDGAKLEANVTRRQHQRAIALGR